MTMADVFALAVILVLSAIVLAIATGTEHL